MNNYKILTITLLCLILLTSCVSNKKILGIIELHETTIDDLQQLNFIDNTEKWFDEENQVFKSTYLWHQAEYKLNGVKGYIRIPFTSNGNTSYKNGTAYSVNFSADTTTNNMYLLTEYLTNTYGKHFEELDQSMLDNYVLKIERWTSGDLIIDYVLTNENTIEIRWYNNGE